MEERFLAAVGGMAQFESGWNWRSFKPKERAASNLAEAVEMAESGMAILAAKGFDAEQAEPWLAGLVKKWAAYQHAGARCANPMITGPARFPVERNRKRMEIERRRGEELYAYANSALRWAHRQERMAVQAAAPEVEPDIEKNGVKFIRNAGLDRVQIVFPGKPEPAMIAKLKQQAFRWAPSLGVWQRQLTANGVRAAQVILALV